MQNLVIVESPTKARTLSKFLGSKYQVEASMGHVRDLPKADLGIDVENNFNPRYIIPRDKIKRVNELKKEALGAKTLWLATDPDREGEAIAWHIKELVSSGFGVSGKKKKTMNYEPKTTNQIHRVVFHEITEEAIKEAFDNPRNLDIKLVDAQQARRVLDRLVGYKLSPLLWKKVKSGLSAGRVQSVALRLIVEREREIEAFKPVEYWSIEAELISARGPVASVSQVRPRSLSLAAVDARDLSSAPPLAKLLPNSFVANLVEKDGKKLAIKTSAEAEGHLKALEKAEYQVSKVTQKEVRKYPAPPFTTSTLQQAAANRLGLTAKKTMMIAQVLYERGLITYMRTDSVNLSDQALKQARSFIEQNLGKNYLPPSPRLYKTKSKVAQEAHEAIRPTNIQLTSEKFKNLEGLTREHLRVYDLIWKRMVASQVKEAISDQTTVDVTANSYTFRATGSVIKFEGWLKVYGKVVEEGEEEGGQALPELTVGELLELLKLIPGQHFTEPPPRFNDASLIKKLEELGIGRPSTYASILATILDRFYVERQEKRFFPTPLGIAVILFLEKNFANILDYDFTAQMEDELDEIARGEREWRPTIKEFYEPFSKKLEEVEETAGKVEIEAEVVDRDCPECGKKLQIKYGRFGKFLACTGFPECKHTENLEEKLDIPCPDCGGEVVLRKTKKGRPFYGCKNYPNCKFASWTKPKK
ncbi:MAG: type I DNA topoisomerase [bacterium]|nr:type I DNA topoisomerase [bacterium]